MAQHSVDLVATEGVFRGLAKQNLLFHQCIEELCDNAIASAKDGVKPLVDIFLNPDNAEPSLVDLWVCDNGCGMNLPALKDALQLGKEPSSNCRLNEHGFGLKNALATLSGGNGQWNLWTRSSDGTELKVDGPFSSTIIIQDDISFPSEPFLPSDCSTIIHVKVKMSFVQTVQGRGAPTNSLPTLRMWLIEHLGVAYRGYLELDQATQDTSARISVSINTDRKVVPPVNVPLGNARTEYFDVFIGETAIRITYRYGTLDEVLRDKLLYNTDKAKYYYQKNIPTQGIDIRLGKRVIATRQLETIWKTEDGKSQLVRHNDYNDFVGEVLIPDVPRGKLSTVNNKTDFNLDDPNWAVIFNELNKIRPPKNVREMSESALKKKWIDMLKATNPNDEVTDEHPVWPVAARIDVLRESIDGSIIIYELKATRGEPIHLYQLKMYWDGLLLGGKQPKEAVLLVDDYSTALEAMANQMNQLTPPKLRIKINEKDIIEKDSLPYCFRIERLKDLKIKV